MCDDSYEQDPELFSFDYKNDLHLMARERERVFSMSKFSTMANEEDEDSNTQMTRAEVFNRIYAANDIPSARGMGTIEDDSVDEEYVEPERTSYPTNQGIVNFGQVPRPNRFANDMQFDD